MRSWKSGESIASNAYGNAEGKKSEKEQMKQEDEELSNLFPDIDFRKIKNPETRKILIQNKVKQKEKDTEMFSTGLTTLDEMEAIVNKGNVGRGSAFWGAFGGETAQDRAKLRQLGTSLIPIVAAGVSIKNQTEFEEYKKVITDPSALTSEIKGAIDGLRYIFNKKLQGKKSKTRSSNQPKQNNTASSENRRSLKDILG